MSERINLGNIIKAGAMTLAATGLSYGLVSSPVEAKAQSNTGMPDNPVCVIDSYLSDHHLTEADDIDARIALLKETGAKTTRFDFELVQINTADGVWNFERYDEIVDKLKENGIETIALLDQFAAPEWKAGDSYGYMDVISTPEEFGNFAGKVAEHFKGRIKLVEFTNEPNRNWQSPKGPDVATYVDYQNAGYEAVKAVDPEITVISGGVDAHEGRKWVTDMIQDGAEFDAVGLHPYGHNNDSLNIVADVKGILAENDMDKPVIITEIGWPTIDDPDEGVTEGQQAANIAEMFNKIKKDDVPADMACVYSDQDKNADEENPDSVENHYGAAYRIDGTSKPGIKALQEASASFESN